MAGYQIDFTDQNTIRSFNLSEYTTNGPTTPIDGTLDANAVAASTSLLLYGRGMPNYGEKMQENIINVLENFSNPIEPVYPIKGQMWNDTSQSPPILRVYNTEKYLIQTDIDNPGALNWFSLTAPNATEEAAMLARFVTNFRIRIVDTTDNSQEEYLITSNAILNTNGLVTFQINPTPSLSRTTPANWYIGGWEYMVQNNTALHEDLDAGTWKVINLATPTNNQDATTKSYVDTEISTAISNNNQLGELQDVNIPTATTNDILVFTGTEWVNTDGSAIFLLATGGVMGGTIDMSGGSIIPSFYNKIINLGYPLASSDAANKQYVDDVLALASGGAVTSLDGLTDVTLTGAGSPPVPTVDSLLYFNGVVWTNTTITDFANDFDFVISTGDTMSGPLEVPNSTFGVSGSNDAANLGYVDNEIVGLNNQVQQDIINAIATVPPNDGVVDGGSYNASTLELTLTRTVGVDVVITGFGTGGTFTDLIVHAMGNPNGGLLNKDTNGFAFEEFFASNGVYSGTYPDIIVADLLSDINAELGKFSPPKQRLVFTANGSSTIYLSDTSGGALANQMNPIGELGNVYTVGTNGLQIHVNGVKQYGSDHGFRIISSNTPNYGLWQSTQTGLTPTSTYSFSIDVNSQGAVVIPLDGNVVDITTLSGIAKALNDLADTNFFNAGVPDSQYAFSVKFNESDMFIYSCLPGTGSSIDLVDIDLFSSMVGTAVTLPFTIDLPLSNGIIADANYAPTDFHYKEDGRCFTESQTIIFNAGSEPANGAIVEIIIDRELFNERLP